MSALSSDDFDHLDAPFLFLHLCTDVVLACPLARNFKMPSPWRILPRAICAPFSGCRVCKLRRRRSAERAENKELAVRPSAIPRSERARARGLFSCPFLVPSPLARSAPPFETRPWMSINAAAEKGGRGHFKFATLRIQSSPHL